MREDLAELQREHLKALRGDLVVDRGDQGQGHKKPRTAQTVAFGAWRGANFWESERLLPVLRELCAHRRRALEAPRCRNLPKPMQAQAWLNVQSQRAVFFVTLPSFDWAKPSVPGPVLLIALARRRWMRGRFLEARVIVPCSQRRTTHSWYREGFSSKQEREETRAAGELSRMLFIRTLAT